MAEDVRQHFGTDSAITITLNSLADGSSATSSAIDLGAQGPFALALECKLDGAGAGAVDLCDVFAQWSNDNTDFSDSLNDEFVGAVQMNGTTAVIAVFTFPVQARYLKVRVENQSGASLETTGNTLRYVPISVDQA